MEVLNSILQVIGSGISQFIEFSQRDFDAFFAIYLVILGIIVLVSILMLFNQIVKWIRGEKDGIRQR